MADKVDKITVFSFTGSIITGLLASLCCIGPLVFVFLGLSGAAFFAKFEEYRWIFGTLAFGFLAIGFFFTYKGGEDCTRGTSCTINPGRRRLNKMILWVSAVLVIGFILSPNIIGFFLT